MHACLDAYNAGGWDGTVCAAHGWYKGGAAWRSAEDCYAACQPCVARAIEAGAPEVNCYTQIDFAGCWMGYNSGKN
ncbi:MAG: hypothetical protein M1832_005656 [Thelocarpon impressellum]|nr:MAG: hypothetical protein M1832_005656 [Thelocarpon impressellum]